MGKNKHALRYKQSSIAIISGMVIALLGIFYGDFLNQLNRQEQEEIQDFTYQNQYMFSILINESFEMDSLMELLDQPSITVMADAISAYVDAKYNECWARAVLFPGDGLKYHLCEGRYPTEEELKQGKPVVVLGRAQKPYTYQKDGEDYILILGEEYQVVGYCSGIHTTVLNYTYLFFYPCLGSQLRKELLQAGDTWMLHLVLSSDTKSVNSLYESVKTQLEAQGFQVGELTELPLDYTGAQYKTQHKLFSYLIYGFSMFITIVIIQYWIYQRTFEFAIRRIYGYTRFRLLLHIGKELCVLLVIAGVIAGVLYGIVGVTYYLVFGILLTQLGMAALRVLGILLGTFIILMIYPMWNIYHQQALDAYRNG